MDHHTNQSTNDSMKEDPTRQDINRPTDLPTSAFEIFLCKKSKVINLATFMPSIPKWHAIYPSFRINVHLGEISMLTLGSELVLGQVDVYYFCSNNKQRAGNVTRSCQSGSSSVTYCTLVYKTVTFWLVIHALKL